jgi:hypothetical protein
MKNNIKKTAHKEATVDNKLEQYYAKSSGCSVKPQEKNLHDYKPMLKENRNYLGLIKNDDFIIKAEKKINEAILKITLNIKEQFPELSKYTLEMPITIPNVENPKINLKVLQDYYKSLEELMQHYINNQTVVSK